MATILELAAHAEVSAETVLRVVNGEPVNEEVERRVRDAIAELGPQHLRLQAKDLASLRIVPVPKLRTA